MKKETREWIELSEEDLQVARLALDEGIPRTCIFHCQQALEKLLKAIWIEKAAEGYPPREHNLTLLAAKGNVVLDAGRQEFFDSLSKQYMPTRYADVAIEEEVEYSKEQAENYYRRTAEEFQWLRQQLN
jgi:HEPN domain-containing protein